MLRGGGICEYNANTIVFQRRVGGVVYGLIISWNGRLAVSNISRNISGFDDLQFSHLPLCHLPTDLAVAH